jgi:phospholipid/cholesterol/gamma-HCH transport system substrate-binding protein
MKKTIGNKLKLGIFVTITVALFIAGIYFVGKKQQLFNDTFRISAVFKDISGLEVGNNVRFSGINVGMVEDIRQITDSTVQVDMIIDEDTRKFMKKKAKAIIGSDGLMGNKLVIIIPGPACKQTLADNDVIATAQTVSMDDLLIKIKITTDNAATLTGDLSAIIGSIRSGKGTIGRLLMDTSMAQNVNEALINIKQGAGGFKQNMTAASHNFLLRGFFKKRKEEKKEKEKEEEKNKK